MLQRHFPMSETSKWSIDAKQAFDETQPNDPALLVLADFFWCYDTSLSSDSIIALPNIYLTHFLILRTDCNSETNSPQPRQPLYQLTVIFRCLYNLGCFDCSTTPTFPDAKIDCARNHILLKWTKKLTLIPWFEFFSSGIRSSAAILNLLIDMNKSLHKLMRLTR